MLWKNYFGTAREQLRFNARVHSIRHEKTCRWCAAEGGYIPVAKPNAVFVLSSAHPATPPDTVASRRARKTIKKGGGIMLEIRQASGASTEVHGFSLVLERDGVVYVLLRQASWADNDIGNLSKVLFWLNYEDVETSLATEAVSGSSVFEPLRGGELDSKTHKRTSAGRANWRLHVSSPWSKGG
jgi:hypothetical protein